MLLRGVVLEIALLGKLHGKRRKFCIKLHNLGL